MDDLNRAVALYFRHIPLAVGADPELFAAAFGDDATVLAARIQSLVGEVFAIEVEWDVGDLAHWADRIAATLVARHPELTSDSARLLANYWSYNNR
ncbi:hypothetical protein ABH931_006424 [Streptacidiphilus sp. MAP12-33]|uniref:hypothetical protein n=1 Tax=Streptacidiphilus sp. MAP12-33 TaxID=3156266 RepID=UPI0035174D77